MGAPPGGWRHVMTANGIAVHLCDPEYLDAWPGLPERRALCGISPVYFAPHPDRDPLTVNGLCARCLGAALRWEPGEEEGLPAPSGADPLLPLLRAAGLREELATAAAGIARGYLAAELGNALARAQAAAGAAQQRIQEHADRLAGAGGPPLHPAPVVWRGIDAGLTWARDVVHARRTWPPQPEPPAPPDGIGSDTVGR